MQVVDEFSSDDIKPYSFDFLTIQDDYDEKELENALVNQITQFLFLQRGAH